ncbi:Lrp/AsnC family transcriptional regulator [Arthrobacter sp. 31Y]|uniref:Lrp/AsnC family transcriptional regulator n=1 Tax=Arthrobacter sp. 31Y TaxID=1115632 RepID=UPI00046403EA|nr:Lrp/AsnC family transcriptional regulator [Arthrobacter sp. 31Y]
MPKLLDEEDLQLVHALQIGPRLPWSTLGEILDRHPTSLGTRWRNLEEMGYAWISSNPVGSLDQMTVSIHHLQCTLSDRADAIKFLSQAPEVVSIDERNGSQDLMLTVVTPTASRLVESVYPLFNDVPGIVGYETAFCTRLHQASYSWQVTALSPQQQRSLRDAVAQSSRPPYTGAAPSHYWPVVRELSRNGRATGSDIAAVTGIHPATARRQLNKVLDSGALTFRCEVAHQAAGYPLIGQWFCRLPIAEHERAASLLAKVGKMRLCASITGSSNFMFMIWLRSPAEALVIENALDVHVPLLKVTESTLIISTPKRLGSLLHADGSKTGSVALVDDSWVQEPAAATSPPADA